MLLAAIINLSNSDNVEMSCSSRAIALLSVDKTGLGLFLRKASRAIYD